jgi:hypothetical protein
MTRFKNWLLVAGGCLFAVGLMVNNGWASYTSSDNRLPSPTYRSTNSVTFATAGGLYTIDSFFDVFTELDRFAPPPLGSSTVHSFFDVFTELSIDPPSGPPVTVHSGSPSPEAMRLNGLPPGTPYIGYVTEMLQLDLSGGTMPAGMRIRESPTLLSAGETRIDDVGGGLYKIDSFFDVFTELSLDNGQTWIPGSSALHIEGNLPEPSTAILALLGLAALNAATRRRICV